MTTLRQETTPAPALAHDEPYEGLRILARMIARAHLARTEIPADTDASGDR